MLISHALPYGDPSIIVKCLLDQPWLQWLDGYTGSTTNEQNRYSYLVCDPFTRVRFVNQQLFVNDEVTACHDPFQWLQQYAQQFRLPLDASYPPFQGGMVGMFNYDCCHFLEPVTRPGQATEQADISVGFYDCVISIDHQQQACWILSTGFPAKDSKEQQRQAQQRLDWLLTVLARDPVSISAFTPLPSSDVSSNFDQASYAEAVKQAQEKILAGDIFEVNIAQRFSAPWTNVETSFALYEQLRQHNPAPFSAYCDFGDRKIASSSPERFLLVDNKQVETRPIKGTRPRGKTLTEDQTQAHALLDSEKDWAENIMIVDLMRNDLSRVCQPGSIKVPQLCGLESFSSVHHLVSVVQGTLASEYNALDCLRVCFPGGSITGAPKVRAMQLIAEIEQLPRGPYCGSLVAWGFSGYLDSSILIRTIVMADNEISFHAGGAVTMDSDPMAEYDESLQKARKLLDVVTGHVG